MSSEASIVPSLYIKRVGETSTKAELRLTTAAHRFVVRFTGGCGYMSAEDAQGLYALFQEAFQGFAGAILYGGTRMVDRNDPSIVVPGITEIPPLIWQDNPTASILGVVPRSGDLQISDLGMIVSDEPSSDYITIIHPHQSQCLVVQQSADKGADWTAEFKECLRITNDLRSYVDWNSLLISYNGGGVTEQEILATAEKGWPVLLINGSGRKSEEYANNEEFLQNYPNVLVAEKSAESIRSALVRTGALQLTGLGMPAHLSVVGETA